MTSASIVSPDAQISEAPPAYFLSLSIENFRCFSSKQTLDLSDGSGHPAKWTILLGENGVGKTTLLQALVAFEPEMVNSNTVSLKASVIDIDGGARLHFMDYFGESVRTGQRLYDLASEVVFGKALSDRTSLATKASIVVRGGRGSGKAMTGHSTALLGLRLFAYGAVRRMGQGAISESRDTDPCASLFFESANLINAEEWLLQADYAAKAGDPSGHAVVWRDRTKRALIDLLPDVEDLRFAIGEAPRYGAFVEAKTPYGWVRLRDLSLGYRTLIAWLVDFASRMFVRYPASENPLAEPAIVLVDEIDLHLHPRWQRSIMSYLSNLFPNTQFVATAHSPLVVQAATDANIVVLRREGDHVVIDNDPAIVRNWRVDQILTSELFGLESARPQQLDGLLRERERILGKSKLTKKDEARLEAIGAEIGGLPTGETPADIEAMDIVRRAAARLKQLEGEKG